MLIVQVKEGEAIEKALKKFKKKFEKTEQLKKLYRNTNKKIFGGVCSGFANYFGISVILMRILWLILSIFFCVGIFIYMILWVAIPDKRFSKSDIDKNFEGLETYVEGSILI